MLESEFQHKVIKRLKKMYPDCMVLKNDSSYIQGVPDLIVLVKDKWASLEVKISANAKHQPNQDFYVDKMNRMSYSAFINPDNEEEIFNEIQQTFGPGR